MKISLLQILLVLSFLSFTMANGGQNTQSAPHSLSFTITAPEPVVKAGSAVKVKIKTTNTSGQEVVYYESAPWHYNIYVHDNTGAFAPETSEGLRKHPWSPHRSGLVGFYSGPSFRSRMSIAPGGKQEDEVDVTKEYDLSQPGKYTVQIERPDPENKGKHLKSNTITITVTP